jgi:hypothetical protein
LDYGLNLKISSTIILYVTAEHSGHGQHSQHDIPFRVDIDLGEILSPQELWPTDLDLKRLKELGPSASSTTDLGDDPEIIAEKVKDGKTILFTPSGSTNETQVGILDSASAISAARGWGTIIVRSIDEFNKLEEPVIAGLVDGLMGNQRATARHGAFVESLTSEMIEEEVKQYVNGPRGSGNATTVDEAAYFGNLAASGEKNRDRREHIISFVNSVWEKTPEQLRVLRETVSANLHSHLNAEQAILIAKVGFLSNTIRAAAYEGRGTPQTYPPRKSSNEIMFGGRFQDVAALAKGQRLGGK